MCSFARSVTLLRQTLPLSEHSQLRQQPTEPMRDLLSFLDVTLNDLMFSLYRNRQVMMDVQQRVGKDASLR